MDGRLIKIEDLRFPPLPKIRQVVDGMMGPIGMPWLESPFVDDILSDLDLNAESASAARQLSEEGFLLLDLTSQMPLLDSIVANLSPRYGREGRLTNAWEYDDSVRRLAVLPEIRNLLESLFGREVIPYQTLNFPVGTQQRGHTDIVHFQSSPQRYMCGVWVALEDVDSDNGPLFYYPGSHRLPIFDDVAIGFELSKDRVSERYLSYESFIEKLMASASIEKKVVHVAKGTAVVWLSNLVHGGSVIRDSERTRHSQVTHYFFSDCRYYSPIRSQTVDGQVSFIKFRNIQTRKLVMIPELANVYPRKTLMSRARGMALQIAERTISARFRRKIMMKRLGLEK